MVSHKKQLQLPVVQKTISWSAEGKSSLFLPICSNPESTTRQPNAVPRLSCDSEQRWATDTSENRQLPCLVVLYTQLFGLHNTHSEFPDSRTVRLTQTGPRAFHSCSSGSKWRTWRAPTSVRNSISMQMRRNEVGTLLQCWQSCSEVNFVKKTRGWQNTSMRWTFR